MNRIKSFDATGIAPNGFLYSGDLNAIQDASAALTDLGQTISVGALAIGESGLQLLHFGSGEARISGALRTDGIFRGLGGVYSGAFTTTQRNAIPAGFRPYGLVVTNTTTNQLEWNSNTDVSPTWSPVGSTGAGYVNALNGIIFGGDTTISRSAAGSLNYPGTFSIGSQTQDGILNLYGNTITGGRFAIIKGTDANPTFVQLTDGSQNWGSGGNSGTDTEISRTAPGVLTVSNIVNATVGYRINGTALTASHLSNGVTGSGAIVLANAPTFTGVPLSVTPPTVDNSTKVATTAWVIAQGYVSTTGISVSSVFGRTGAITAQTGDYSAAQVTSAADKSASGIQTFTGNVGSGGAPTAAGGSAGTSILSAGGLVASRAVGGAILSGTVPGDTVYRIAADNTGLFSWSSGSVVSDTTMGRTGPGVITVTSYLNAINGFQVNGVALAASHLSNSVTGSGAIVLAANPALSGSPTATTASTADNSLRIATTAYVNSLAGTIAPVMDSAAAIGTSQFYARQDHVHPSDTAKASLSGATFTGNVTALNFTATAGTVTSPTLNFTTNLYKNGVPLAASHLSNGITGGGAVVLQSSPTLIGTLTVPTLTATSTVQVSGTGGLGYSTGSGATATIVAGTSAVLSKSAMTGKLTGSTAVAAGGATIYTVTGGAWGATDVILLNLTNGVGLGATNYNNYYATIYSVGAGTFSFYFYNANTSSVTPTFNFVAINGVTS